MLMTKQVDVVLNIFAKPYQTALSLLSLLKFSSAHIDAIYLQFEPAGSRYDAEPPYAIAHYLQEHGYNVIIYQPEIWVECDAVETERLNDTSYRLAMRYQHAFESTNKNYLFFMHNDVLVKRDVIGAMCAEIGEHFIIGQVGQCWNCPASNASLMHDCGLGKKCSSERYFDFRPNPQELRNLYALAKEREVFVRPYWEGWDKHYSEQGWPMPECRVNEWGCMVNMPKVRNLTMPKGNILPFGAFEYCGSVTLDTSAAWFRELSRLGLKAKHFDINKYIKHWVGSFRMSGKLHKEAEQEAESILLKVFPDFVKWCKNKKLNMFL